MSAIREVPAGTRWVYADLAQGWGYPRKVSGREVETGHWFTNEDAIVWFIEVAPGAEQWKGVLAVHGIGNPTRRGRALTGRAAVALEVIGELLGATKLYSLIPKQTPNMPVLAMRRYLRRYGWSEDEFGSYKLLGG